MSELVLIKTLDHPDIKSSLPLEAIVGMSVSNEKTAIEHNYRITGHETEERLSGTDDILGAIADFFHETQVRERDERQSYNCHSFVAYSIGQQSTSRHTGASNFKLVDVDTSPSHLEPTIPYGLINSDNEHIHSTLGINRPEYSLGVLGTNNPLVICANGLLKYLYNARQIREIQCPPY
jgi:hypothetical protein